MRTWTVPPAGVNFIWYQFMNCFFKFLQLCSSFNFTALVTRFRMTWSILNTSNCNNKLESGHFIAGLFRTSAVLIPSLSKILWAKSPANNKFKALKKNQIGSKMSRNLQECLDGREKWQWWVFCSVDWWFPLQKPLCRPARSVALPCSSPIVPSTSACRRRDEGVASNSDPV